MSICPLCSRKGRKKGRTGLQKIMRYHCRYCNKYFSIEKSDPSLIPHISGPRHPFYKSGSYITEHGYKVVLAHGHPRARKGYVFEHILIMEESLGRYIQKDEHIHHIDHNRQNNNISNLILLSSSEHSKVHHPGLPLSGIRCLRCGSLDNVKSSRTDNAYRCHDCKTIFRHPYKEPQKAKFIAIASNP